MYNLKEFTLRDLYRMRDNLDALTDILSGSVYVPEIIDLFVDVKRELESRLDIMAVK